MKRLQGFLPIGFHTDLILNQLRCERALREFSTGEIIVQSPETAKSAPSAKETTYRIIEAKRVEQKTSHRRATPKQIPLHSDHRVINQNRDSGGQPNGADKDKANAEQQSECVIERLKSLAGYKRRMT